MDELLGHVDSSAALYVRAKLTLEQLATEPMVGEADRTVLARYAAGFAWRLAALRTGVQLTERREGVGCAASYSHPPPGAVEAPVAGGAVATSASAERGAFAAEAPPPATPPPSM